MFQQLLLLLHDFVFIAREVFSYLKLTLTGNKGAIPPEVQLKLKKWPTEENSSSLSSVIDFESLNRIPETFVPAYPQKFRGHWQMLPHVVVENIMSRMTLRQRFNCSLVCPRWSQGLYTPSLWKHFKIDLDTFSQLKYNRFTKNYEIVFNRRRFDGAMKSIGYLVQKLTIPPIEDYYYLGKLLTGLSTINKWTECGEDISRSENSIPFHRLRSVSFVFACENRLTDRIQIVGTGGVIFNNIMELLGGFKNLTHLKCNNLLIDHVGDLEDTLHRGLAESSLDTLKELEIINFTMWPYQLDCVLVFPNLTNLSINSLQVDIYSLSDDFISKLSKLDKFRRLIIVKDKNTPSIFSFNNNTTIDPQTWLTLKMYRPDIQLSLEWRNLTDDTIDNSEMILKHAAVSRAVYSGGRCQLTASRVLDIGQQYHATLTTFIQNDLPRLYSKRNFRDRSDLALLNLLTFCPHLRVIVFNGRLSMVTPIFLVVSRPRPRLRLAVRRNALLSRCDWPAPSCDQTENAIDSDAWVKYACTQYYKCYDNVCREMSRLLEVKWTALSDRQFCALDVKALH